MVSFRTITISVFLLIASVLLYQYAYQCPNLDTLPGKVVIITGSSSGIGEELAYQYAKYHTNLVLVARREKELQIVGDKAKQLGAKQVLVIPADMSNGQSCEDIIYRTVKTFGRIDILLINHAAFDDQLFIHYDNITSLDSMIHQFKVNVMGNAYMTRAALPYLENTEGHIAVVSSGSAKIAAPFHIGYVTSKKALHGFYDTLRHELHLLKSKVTIGILVLGMIATPEVIKDAKLRPLAMPVPACAYEMICAIQTRWEESYVPKWIGPWTAITYIHPWISETTMNNFYLFNVERYVKDISYSQELLKGRALATSLTAKKLPINSDTEESETSTTEL